MLTFKCAQVFHGAVADGASLRLRGLPQLVVSHLQSLQ